LKSIIPVVEQRSRVSTSILLVGDRINIYGPITTSAAFPYAVVLLGAHCL